MKSQSVLVIDDEPVMLQLLERVFEAEGYNVTIAIDDTSGMTKYTESRPDMVLQDIMMPGPDGYMVLERIRRCSDVPVIMLTGALDTESVQKRLDFGADAREKVEERHQHYNQERPHGSLGNLAPLEYQVAREAIS